MKWEVVYTSCKGGRAVNQDYCGYKIKHGILCMVVADGLGGYENKDYISKLAVTTILKSFMKKPECSQKSMQAYIELAAGEVLKETAECSKYEKMKTTLALIITDGSKVVCGHVGDTRIYLLNKEGIIYQSKDHSLVQEMVNRYELREDQIRFHPKRHIITSALGMKKKLEFTITEIESTLKKDDYLMICTDGFWEPIGESIMTGLLKEMSSVEEWLKQMTYLITHSQTEGSDNFTCISARVMNEGVVKRKKKMKRNKLIALISHHLLVLKNKF